jgi:hypothetical protein
VTDAAEMLSEATRLGILQGRFEALHQRAGQVEPRHLLLGLLKTMDSAHLTRLGLDPAACAAIIVQLGSTPAPAPLAADDIEYTDSCVLTITRAIEDAEGAIVEPANLLAALRAWRDGEMTMTDDNG